MSQTDKLITKSPYGELVRQARAQRVSSRMQETPTDGGELRHLAELIDIVQLAARQTPGAEVIYRHLKDAHKCAVMQATDLDGDNE